MTTKIYTLVEGRYKECQISRETDKAFLLVFGDNEFQLWCPKSIWHNPRNFQVSNKLKLFVLPYFLKLKKL